MGKIHHLINGKIHYFDWAMFHCFLYVHQRISKHGNHWESLGFSGDFVSVRYFFRGFELQTYCQCLCLCRFCHYALQSKNQSLLLFDTAAPLLQGCETLVVNSHQKCRPIGDWWTQCLQFAIFQIKNMCLREKSCMASWFFLRDDLRISPRYEFSVSRFMPTQTQCPSLAAACGWDPACKLGTAPTQEPMHINTICIYKYII